MVRGVEHLPSRHEALSSNPVTLHQGKERMERAEKVERLRSDLRKANGG
jgi:hypothetical protein